MDGLLLAGRYRVHGELGRGATSIAYLAEDTAEARPVVVKPFELSELESIVKGWHSA